MEKQTLNWRF